MMDPYNPLCLSLTPVKPASFILTKDALWGTIKQYAKEHGIIGAVEQTFVK
jgi:hypothetical protein